MNQANLRRVKEGFEREAIAEQNQSYFSLRLQVCLFIPPPKQLILFTSPGLVYCPVETLFGAMKSLSFNKRV